MRYGGFCFERKVLSIICNNRIIEFNINLTVLHGLWKDLAIHDDHSIIYIYIHIGAISDTLLSSLTQDWKWYKVQKNVGSFHVSKQQLDL